ncbi:glycerophosphodiester phosphodiesterase family protein [Kordiimonas sp. SCSIO 12610]|uniref:glycerophosphodiester phosphodiesterase family protein n=1 Tax=Kordiimonas sp. SCSIO 12610 TaxID=2829597 RepID=UPI00210C59D7|nr:glycerophosphodiester phosphodiesterase family protein [Kordiimonas sp. SCSIO 12610]UTW54007.1 glycerophosphodiester phosphodiesterase family protein [Kordiimonas sp. SCSIO 12610]
MRYLRNFLIAFLFTQTLVTNALLAAEDTIEILGDDVPRHYISIPEGKLPQFLSWHPVRIPFVSAHRGGPMPGYPENAIETFDHALKYGPALIELDIVQLKDGTLVLMHDDTLDRTTTGTGNIKEKTWDEIKDLYLKDNDGNVTKFRIPTLEQTLLWGKGRALLNLDFKRGTDFKKVADLIRKTGSIDHVIAISYNMGMAKALHSAHPDMAMSVSINDLDDIKEIKESGLPLDRLVAWTGLRELDASVYKAIHDEGWLATIGTLGFDERGIDNQIIASGNEERYQELVIKGGDILATDRHWAVQKVIRNPNFFYFVRSPKRSVR